MLKLHFLQYINFVNIQGDSEISLEKKSGVSLTQNNSALMTFGGEIKRMEITLYLVFPTPVNRENLSEFVHFISNHCYINSTIKS
jgi:hypothetical protein